MDHPTQEPAPISIITLLDRNILYFRNEIAALGDKIIRAKSREHLRQQLESEKSELQKLLELNQSFKRQLLLNLEKLNTTVNELAPLAEQSKNLPPITPIDPTHQFTYPKVTHLDINQLAQETEDRITGRINTILQNQGDTIITEASKVTISYMQDINRLAKEIEETKLLLAEEEKSLQQKKKYFLCYICAGIPSIILCAVCITKYFFPQ